MKKVKEREDGDAYIYKGENNIIISHHHFPSNECCVCKVPRLRLGHLKSQTRELKAASRGKRKEAAFQKKRTRHG